ncbi:3-ketoacyl-(acyl-carrier-protein) reductase [alpha proteobacterium BAL199]|jgi:outer membrane protein assembly factor BamB|nr:3-ketoacyl-(acyl-carrier-protein) reductase [alpha proteobacterium BAL199]
MLTPRRLVHRFAPIGALLIAVTLTACGSGGFFGEEEGKPLPGDRIPVLTGDDLIKADESIASLPVILPPPHQNPDWSQSGGNASKSMGHLAAAEVLREAWSVSVGSGGDDDAALLSQPIIAGGRIFVLDSEARLSALDPRDGRTLWNKDLRTGDDQSVFPGGIASDGEKVYAATGVGEAMALASEDGREIWKVRLSGPVRGSPTVINGQVYVVTLENRTIVLSAEDGRRLWEHQGINEVAALLGGAAPAVSGSTVLAPYSSGELYALLAQNGRVVWVENLSSARTMDAISRLADIRGNPVVDRDLAFAVSHAGRMAAVDVRTGARVWERPIGGVHMPWVAGDFVFVLSLNGDVVAMSRRDGRIRWVHRLPPFEDMEDREDPIQYSGPVLVGDRLLVGSSDGFVYAISPYTGELLGRIEIGSAIFVSPVVADGTVYILSDNGTLHAYR